VDRLRALLEQQAVQFFWSRTVRSASREHAKVETNMGPIAYGYLFNCADAHADMLARSFGLARDYALIPFKGIYLKLCPKANHLVRTNIYSVPDISLPFLGIHFTRVINGDVYVGPTAIPVLGRENYGLLHGIRLKEAVDIGWQLASMYLQNRQNFRALVHVELRKYRKINFLAAAKKMVPVISLVDMMPTNKAGICPQLVNLRERRLEMDYVLESTKHPCMC
jgi:L-2-hydroxyglutarate oxidase LhgO